MRVYLEHLHVGAELLDEGLDDGLGRGRGRDADALGRHLLARVVLVLGLQRIEIFQFIQTGSRSQLLLQLVQIWYKQEGNSGV